MKRFETQVVALVTCLLFACSSGGPSGGEPLPETPNHPEDPGKDPGEDPGEDPSESNDSTTQVVDGKGATLTTSDGTSLVIPAGALTESVEISIDPVKVDDIVAVPSGSELRSSPKKFTPHGTVFATPVTITLPYKGTANTVLRLDDEEDTTWEVVSSVTFSDSKASFQTSSFSVYAVAHMEAQVVDSQSIGPSGGELTFGSVKVSVPAGALSTTVDVSVADIAASTLSAALPADTTLLGNAFGILPYATTFSTDVTVTLPYTGAANRVLALDDENDTTWKVLTGATFEGGNASVMTSRFGVFAVGVHSVAAPVCDVPSPSAPTGTADASGGNEPYYTWSAIDAVASFESWNSGDGYRSALRITLTPYANACALQEGGYLVPDETLFFLHLGQGSPSAPPGLPELGTYHYTDDWQWDAETPVFMSAGAGGAFKHDRGCLYGGTPAPPETPSGSLTLTAVSETEVQGSFSYSDGFGGEHSGTFTAPICTRPNIEWHCCYEE